MIIIVGQFDAYFLVKDSFTQPKKIEFMSCSQLLSEGVSISAFGRCFYLKTVTMR